MKILVGIDSSPSSEVVLAEVGARPWPDNSVLCVINVLDLFSFPSAIGSVAPVTDAESKAAETMVKSAAERLKGSGLAVETALTEGYPPTSLVEYAHQWNADFIVVGSHGHSGISRFLLGSVAQGVVRTAHCSVEIVRQRTEVREGMRILLGTDGSDYSEAATQSVASRPWPSGTEVRIVSAVKVITPASDPWYPAGDLAGRLLEEHKRQAHQFVEEAEQLMRAAGLKTSTSVLVDGAKASLVDEARNWEADLVVVGSHGRRGLNRFLMGSVSEAVAMHAHCSVDVIRRKSAQSEQ
ncbi:MAG TPA: universal stress protein [Blastocatellia bacterium]|jgi:nucleotide-binding universal stress UspA family protein|nr:universal stress protein [Blastocatellia bacterium]